MDPIKNSYQLVLLFDVENGNPNGDPDAGNMPRVDPDTNRGLVTDVCLKRKIRNYVELMKGEADGYRIYIKSGSVLKSTREETLSQKKLTDGDYDAKQFMCGEFFDIRTFGAVMPVKKSGGSQVRGPVQVSFASSIDTITILNVTITRVAVETEKEKSDDKNTMMGRKYIIPYALYRAEIFISAPLAEKTGFSEEDLGILLEAIVHMFDHDSSAARPKMSVRSLFMFKHDSRL